MKLNQNTTLAALAVAIALPAGIANAGSGKMPPPEMLPPMEYASPFYGSVTVGWESTYLFRGVDFGENAPFGSVDLGVNLAEGVALDVGAWYIQPQEAGFGDELDIYAWLSFPVGPLTASVGATYYYFPDFGGDVWEPGVTLAYDFGLAEIGFGYYYDFEAEGHYLETSLSKSIQVTDMVSFNIGGGISFGDDYYGVSSFNHAFVTAGPSIAITEFASLDFYVGGNFPLEDLADFGEDDDFHGGASLTISF